MVSAISHSIYIITWILNLIFKKFNFYKNFKFSLNNYSYLKKFLYYPPRALLNTSPQFKFKRLYTFKIYTDFSVEFIGMFIAVLTKNYTYIKLKPKFFSVLVWMNLILIKNKLNLLNKTYLLGNADSLTFFSSKLSFTKLHILVFNYPKNVIPISNTVIKTKFHQYFKKIKTILTFKRTLIQTFFLGKNKLVWSIEHCTTTLEKFSELNRLKISSVFFLRKNKVFNKGRYSRNRQYYRTGVYWCIYINVILIIGLYFWFYRFTMNFTYMWWALYLFISSFIFLKALKFKLYKLNSFIIEINLTFKWSGKIIISFFFNVLNLILKLTTQLKKFYNISCYNQKSPLFTFVELFIYPILSMFLQFKYLLLKLLNLFTTHKYTNHKHFIFDYYTLSQPNLFIVKALLLNLIQIKHLK